MSPRAYRSERRAASRQATRQRIVEATFALHAEHGIVHTTHAMVAERADVSVPTVYNHFPTRGDLVQACGAYFLAGAPRLDAGLLDGARSLTARLRALVHAVFDVYAYSAAAWVKLLPEAGLVPELQAVLEELRARIRSLAEAALGRTSADRLALAEALLDFATYRTLVVERSIPRATAEARLVEALEHLTRKPRKKETP